MYFLVLKVHITIVLDYFHIIPIMCSVKPEVRPRVVTPELAFLIEKHLQLADSLANHPVRMEFKVNQVSVSCKLAAALHVYWQLVLTVPFGMWIDTSCIVCVCELVLDRIHELNYVFLYV